MSMTTQQVLARVRLYQEGFAAGAARATRRGGRTYLIPQTDGEIWERGYRDGLEALGVFTTKFTDSLVDNPTLPGVPV